MSETERDSYEGYEYEVGATSRGIDGEWYYRIQIFREGKEVHEEEGDSPYDAREALKQGRATAQAVIDQLATKNSK